MFRLLRWISLKQTEIVLRLAMWWDLHSQNYGRAFSRMMVTCQNKNDENNSDRLENCRRWCPASVALISNVLNGWFCGDFISCCFVLVPKCWRSMLQPQIDEQHLHCKSDWSLRKERIGRLCRGGWWTLRHLFAALISNYSVPIIPSPVLLK